MRGLASEKALPQLTQGHTPSDLWEGGDVGSTILESLAAQPREKKGNETYSGTVSFHLNHSEGTHWS